MADLRDLIDSQMEKVRNGDSLQKLREDFLDEADALLDDCITAMDEESQYILEEAIDIGSNSYTAESWPLFLEWVSDKVPIYAATPDDFAEFDGEHFFKGERLG